MIYDKITIKSKSRVVNFIILLPVFVPNLEDSPPVIPSFRQNLL
jgi:hypothetical protein